MAETWKSVVGYEGIYEVSSLGRVRSLARVSAIGRHLKAKYRKPVINHGYPMLTLRLNGIVTTHAVHRLVLTAFIGPCPDGLEACHNDGNPGNASIGNLRWDTPINNHADKVTHGTTNRGELHPAHKLTADVVRLIRDTPFKWGVVRQLGRELGISHQHVSNIRNSKSWEHA